jgi:hypothetical protein
MTIANVTNICPINSLVGVILGSAAGSAPTAEQIGDRADWAVVLPRRSRRLFGESRAVPPSPT